MTAGRRRQPGQLPPQVGGDPQLARAGCDELRPVGARDRRHRPFQDGVRWPRGPLHRRLGPDARPARACRLRDAVRDAGLVGASTPRPRRRWQRRRVPGRSGGDIRGTRAARDARCRGDATAASSRTGTGGPSMSPAATSTSRAPGRSSGRGSAGGRGTSCSMTTIPRARPSAAWPLVGGASAYIPRGPIADARGVRRTARRPDHRRWPTGWPTRGVDVVATDAEVPAATPGTPAFAPDGFQPIAEIQPSRHRVSLAPAARHGRGGGAGRDRQEHAAAHRGGRARRPDRDRATTRRVAAATDPLFERPSRPLADRRPRRVRDAARGDRRAARLPVRAARAVRGLVGCGPRRPVMLVYLEARDAASRTGPRRADPLPPRRAALDGPLRRRAGVRATASRRHAPAALAGDPAGHPRGARPRWTSAAWTSAGTTPRPASRASRWRAVRAQAVVRGDVGGA